MSNVPFFAPLCLIHEQTAPSSLARAKANIHSCCPGIRSMAWRAQGWNPLSYSLLPWLSTDLVHLFELEADDIEAGHELCEAGLAQRLVVAPHLRCMARQVAVENQKRRSVVLWLGSKREGEWRPGMNQKKEWGICGGKVQERSKRLTFLCTYACTCTSTALRAGGSHRPRRRGRQAANPLPTHPPTLSCHFYSALQGSQFTSPSLDGEARCDKTQVAMAGCSLQGTRCCTSAFKEVSRLRGPWP